MVKLDDETAAAVGYKSGPENRGYLARIHVAETEEQNAKQCMWCKASSPVSRTRCGHSLTCRF